MPESLPGAAPEADEAAPSVEVDAPSDGEAVVTDSAPGQEPPKMVEASRFNGLMGRFNRTQAELQEARERIAELESLVTGTPPVKEENPAMSDTANAELQALREQVSSLQNLLVQRDLEAVKREALEEFPGAKPFADLIIASSPDEVRGMAQLLHERMEQAKGGAPAAPAAEEVAPEAPAAEVSAPAAAETPEPPQVVGGTTATAPPTDPDVEVQEAIQRKDFAGFLRAKWQKAKADEGLTL